MKHHAFRESKALFAALVVSGTLGFAGQGLAQATPGDQSGQSMNPGGTGSMSSSHAIPPSKSEMSDSAFKKLDASNKGYVSQEDAKNMPGFDRAFQSADADHDGRLLSDEFKKAWTSFTGNPQ